MKNSGLLDAAQDPEELMYLGKGVAAIVRNLKENEAGRASKRRPR